MQLNIQATLESVRERLASHSESASLDAQVLLAHVLNKPRSWVLAHPEEILNTQSAADLERAMGRLETGEPLPYVLGRWEFYNLDFYVTPDVLIPRPETELLVERALRWLAGHPNRRRAADIGTGSGCIAISLAANQPDLIVVGVDISRGALQVARRNLSRYNLNQRVLLVQSDLAEALYPESAQHRFDLICANLPYIPEGTYQRLDKLRWEPYIALTGGASGMELIERLARRVPTLLSPGGMLLLEIESSLGESARSLVQSVLPHATVQVIPDLAGLDRLVIAQI